MGNIQEEYLKFQELTKSEDYVNAEKLREKNPKLRLYIRFKTLLLMERHNDAANYLIGHPEVKDLIDKEDLRLILDYYEGSLAKLVIDKIEKLNGNLKELSSTLEKMVKKVEDKN